MTNRLAVLALVLMSCGIAVPPTAHGQGTTTPGEKPKLTIKEADSVQIIRFRDARKAKSATFSLGVSPAPEGDVDPPAPRSAPQGDLISEQNERIPRANVTVKEVTWDGISAFQPKVEVVPGDAKPGRYTGTVNFGGSAYATAASVTVTATLKSGVAWAGLVAFLGWVAGMLLKACTDLFAAPGEKIRSTASLKRYFLRSGFIATVALGAAGAFAAWGFTYLPNDVWGADALDDIKLFGTAMACVVTGTTLSDFFTPFKGDSRSSESVRRSETFKTQRGGTGSLDAMIDPADFMQTHARLLDRRRYELLFAGGGVDPAFAALSGYANPDGGFGHGIEPDLRSPAGQPAGALHAFEVLAEAGPATHELAGALCDWLQAASLPDGGLPFAIAGAGGPGVAPFWAGADPTASSLHITSAVCGMAHRVAAHDPAVASHRWLERATEFCRREIAALNGTPHAIAFLFILQFLDAVGDAGELERLGAYLPASGELPVAGGIADETIRPLDISPRPGGPLRALFDPDVIAADVDRLAGEQRDDGGWAVDFRAYSPAAELEWRGYATVKALATLTAEGRTAGASASA